MIVKAAPERLEELGQVFEPQHKPAQMTGDPVLEIDPHVLLVRSDIRDKDLEYLGRIEQGFYRLRQIDPVPSQAWHG